MEKKLKFNILASLAQLVEHLICNQPVAGSTPVGGSSRLMFKDFCNFIATQNLFNASDKLLLTISGGVDSIVLAHLLFRLKANFAFAHCNFQLRPNAKVEAAQIKQLAKTYNIPFFFKTFDPEYITKQPKNSIQMVARKLRYNWFENLSQQYDYQYILTAHHLNDQLETLLFNITKGTGLAGLMGIPLVRGKFIRPLLFATKDCIYAYARKHNLKWYEDESNLETKYKRNLIRNRVIPILKTINPSLEQTTFRTIKKLDFADKVFNSSLENIRKKLIDYRVDGDYMDLEKLKTCEYQSELFYYLLKPYHFNNSQCQQIYKLIFRGQVGKQVFSTSHRLLKDRTHFIIHEIPKGAKQTFVIPDNLSKFEIYKPYQLKFKFRVYHKNFHISKQSHIANLDYDRLKFPLHLCKWKPGDWFVPLGMKGKKKVSDFLTDVKYSRQEKENTWILKSHGRIVWVLNKRIDDRFKLQAKTKYVFQIELFKFT